MKVKANLSVEIKVKEGETPEEVHDKIIQKLANVCEGWLDGEVIPKININYTLDKDEVDSISEDILN
jgi:hypothetical protein|tara:strand:- start:657 stop:857 length:201 start_codon:yes stop_codon:yes gene_type:complete